MTPLGPKGITKFLVRRQVLEPVPSALELGVCFQSSRLLLNGHHVGRQAGWGDAITACAPAANLRAGPEICVLAD